MLDAKDIVRGHCSPAEGTLEGGKTVYLHFHARWHPAKYPTSKQSNDVRFASPANLLKRPRAIASDA